MCPPPFHTVKNIAEFTSADANQVLNCVYRRRVCRRFCFVQICAGVANAFHPPDLTGGADTAGAAISSSWRRFVRVSPPIWSLE